MTPAVFILQDKTATVFKSRTQVQIFLIKYIVKEHFQVERINKTKIAKIWSVHLLAVRCLISPHVWYYHSARCCPEKVMRWYEGWGSCCIASARLCDFLLKENIRNIFLICTGTNYAWAWKMRRAINMVRYCKLSILAPKNIIKFILWKIL